MAASIGRHREERYRDVARRSCTLKLGRPTESLNREAIVSRWLWSVRSLTKLSLVFE